MINNLQSIKVLAQLRNASRFIYSYIFREQPLGISESEIIQKIHKLRFNPQHPYLTTGGHFADLFVRNMGIFYNALLDPRISSTEEDWHNRQQISYKTIKYALACFAQTPTDATTISPLWGKHFTTSNIYARASDSLYAILYGLKMLTDIQTTITRYPLSKEKPLTRQLDPDIKEKAQQLLTEHRNDLALLIEQYLVEVIDPNTNLIKQNIHLSSARDGIKRQSSFYDNVIAWATIKLATELEIPLHTKKISLDNQRNHILSMYWQEEKGIFKDDLITPTFSADQLVILTTQFLNIHDTDDRQMLHSIVQYIQTHKLDHPFPLHYSEEHNPIQLYWPVRYFAPHYMTHSIWSHWGMEYVKLLILLSPNTPSYLSYAQNHLQKYKENIETYGGYPECYNLQGTPLKEGLYRTVLHTSWVINYEQTLRLYSDYSNY